MAVNTVGVDGFLSVMPYPRCVLLSVFVKKAAVGGHPD